MATAKILYRGNGMEKRMMYKENNRPVPILVEKESEEQFIYIFTYEILFNDES